MCGPAIKRRFPAAHYRKQCAAVIVGLRSRLLAAKYRKQYAAYIIGLRFKTKKVLPEYKENPIRVAFAQKREFQGTLEKKVGGFVEPRDSSEPLTLHCRSIFSVGMLAFFV